MLADAYGWVRQRQHSYLISSLLGIAGFALLWLINIPYRRAYQPSHDDVTALVDGLLLLPGAHWQDWFTQGHSHFFDAYPEWSVCQTAFARPAFQFLIYLAHFVLGKDWASYLAINYLCIAGAAAVAFLVARIAFGLGVGRSLVLAALVLLSPPTFEFSAWEVGYASEALAGVLIACAFLASTMRRDRYCIALLLLALFTKETALWAPFAACATVLLRMGIARPDYIEASLGINAEIVRIIDTTSNSTCRGKHQVIAFDHAISGDEVVIHATVPECATLLVWNARSDRTRISDGRLYRSETVSYEFPDARPASATSDATSAIDLGHRVTVHIRARGPARFIIGDSGPDAAVTWFDTP
jgi:hypothetical protein